MRKFLTLLLIATSSTSLYAQQPAAVSEIEATLNQFHDAASRADASRYFSLFTRDAIYIGTDAAERWTVDEFRAFAEPYFNKGRGWTYTPRQRHVTIADIPCKCVAWFDELLDNAGYGTSRGTGVLIEQDGKWKISQYALTFPIPNDLAKGMTEQIKAFEAKKK